MSLLPPDAPPHFARTAANLDAVVAGLADTRDNFILEYKKVWTRYQRAALLYRLLSSPSFRAAEAARQFGVEAPFTIDGAAINQNIDELVILASQTYNAVELRESLQRQLLESQAEHLKLVGQHNSVQFGIS